MPNPPGYDEVRRRLLERGYLGGRIERFVLRDTDPDANRWAASVRTASKAAVLGAPALGALLAAAVAYANRPWLGVRDAIVLWAYLGVASALVLFVLDLFAAAVVGWIARRRGVTRGDAARAAILAGVPILGYLVYVWWKGEPGGSPWVDVVFLAGALAVTWLVAWLARLVSLADLVRRTGDVPERARLGLLSLAAITVPVVLGVLLLVRGGGSSGQRPAAPFEPGEVPGRVEVLAIDGLDGELLQALDGREVVDGLLDTMAAGAVFPVRRETAAEPTEVWTTVATGMPTDEHGVRNVGSEHIPGVSAPVDVTSGPLPMEAAIRFFLPSRTVPTSGVRRGVLAAWEIVALRRPSAVIGWWATWPARRGSAGGYVVSDRALPKLLSGAPENHDTAPRSLYDRLGGEFETVRNTLRREFDDRFPGEDDDGVRRIAWESYLIDGFHLRVATLLDGDPAVRASFVYLPGLDILRTRLGARGTAADTATGFRIQDTVATYVAWLDEAVARRAGRGDGTRMLVVTDPGRSASRGAEGMMLAIGPGVSPSCIGPVLDPLDVAPTVLAAAGYPASDEMPGRVPTACIAAWDPPARIATFGRRVPVPAGVSSRYDAELLERLRSLGYL